MTTIRVLIAEDHALVRSGIRSLLDAAPGVKVVGEAGEGRAAIELFESLRPDVLLLDVEMGTLNGIETARRVRALDPAARILMLSMYREPQYVFEALKAGATGYLLKDDAFADLITALRSVVAGRRYLSPPLAEMVMDDYVRRANGEQLTSQLDRLSPREREVLQLVAEGWSSPQVASTLHISVRTVDMHRRNISQKLDIHSIAGLTKFAILHGLTPLRQAPKQ